MQLVLAQSSDLSKTIGFSLSVAPQDTNAEIIKVAITSSFESDHSVFWFVFKDDNGQVFGACHCQSIFNYWRIGKRFFVSGVYIEPSFRGKGYVREMIRQLKSWARDKGAVRLCALIKDDNQASFKAFAKAGFWDSRHRLYLCDTDER